MLRACVAVCAGYLCSFLKSEVCHMAGESETAAVQKKVSEVEREQGSMADAGSEPPPNFGHGSTASEGTSGDLIPGGGGTKK